MLIEFSVKNFLSIKDKITLSMEKGNGNENINNIVSINKVDLLKEAVIYGANASGKTNILKAFTCAVTMVRNSNLMRLSDKWHFIKPFMFDKNTVNEPTEFEFIYISNGIKYKYSYAADKDKIYYEALDAYYTQKPTTIFKRENVNEYTFNVDKSKLEVIKLQNTDNKLFLSTATTWNYDKTKDAYLWFNKIDIYDSFDSISDVDLLEYSKNDTDLKDFALKLLKEADIVINDIHVDYQEQKYNSLTLDNTNPDVRIDNTLKISNVKIELEHNINNNIYKLDFMDESTGTKILFAISPILKKAFETNRIIIVDELDKSMHPKLIEFILKLFNNKNINKANSQLIFTTHITNLLNLELLRRDEIWFTEKSDKTGITTLYPLDSFSVRKDENIEKGYINGRYGAIPFIKDIDLWLEDMNK